MKKRSILGASAAFLVGLAVSGCSSMGDMSTAISAFDQLGCMKNVTSPANDLVSSSLQDPRLSGLVDGRRIDSVAASRKVSDQLCAAFGGNCKAPWTDEQVSAAAKKLSPEQSRALSDNFSSALNRIASDPKTRDVVSKALGSKLSGIIGGLF